nr:MAG TPA: hypothetical protein [Caudoviricetes sp.]
MLAPLLQRLEQPHNNYFIRAKARGGRSGFQSI